MFRRNRGDNPSRRRSKANPADIKLAFRRGSAFLARRRRLPGAKEAFREIPKKSPYAFGRDTIGPGLAQQVGKRFGCDPKTILADVHFALAIEAVLKNCGQSYRPLMFSGRLSRKEIESISRTHSDRQQFEMQQVTEGRPVFAKPDGVERPFDTLGWYEIVGRLARAGGHVRHALPGLFTNQPSAEQELIDGSADQLEMLIESTDAVARLISRNFRSSTPAAWGPQRKNPSGRQFGASPGGRCSRPLAQALGLIIKNARDLPRLMAEQSPTDNEIEAVCKHVNSISEQALAAQLAFACSSRVYASLDGSLRFLGNASRGGTYVLWINVRKRLKLRFGSFKGGKLIEVLKGEYVYTGSALSHRGPTCLANRLVRHASRTGRKRSQSIREEMLREFERVGLSTGDPRPANGKHLRWNVDYLLDRSEVDLVGALVIRSPHRIEQQLGKFLENDPASVAFAPGLGANDLPGSTHLLRIEGAHDWWQLMPGRLIAYARRLRAAALRT